jgi:hypothetical protein
MVFKHKPNITFNLLILILISLLLLMLYLGNYNLIEGNDTSSQVMRKLESLVENSEGKSKVLKDNISYNTACVDQRNMDSENADYIRNMGGMGNPASHTVHNANQTIASLCSKNT